MAQSANCELSHLAEQLSEKRRRVQKCGAEVQPRDRVPGLGRGDSDLHAQLYWLTAPHAGAVHGTRDAMLVPDQEDLGLLGIFVATDAAKCLVHDESLLGL